MDTAGGNAVPIRDEAGSVVAVRVFAEACVMSSAQVGKTEIVNNILACHIDHDPCPMLVLQPTLEMAEAWSKDRLAPMLRDTPQLRDTVKDPRTRDSGNTLRHKTFPGGQLTMAGANSPASLASRPVRVVMCDEVDRYPISAGTEGDPVALARKRTSTFWNRFLLMTSTPTIKGASRIESAYDESTQERYWVPCPHCAQMQPLAWAQVRWEEGRPQTARYVCLHCAGDWTDADRWKAIRGGEWRSRSPDALMRGFHLSELYSPWTAIADMAAAFLSAKRLPETLKTWVNTSLGETWEDKSETLDHDLLWRTRREPYGPIVPQGACLLTAGVDVQRDRIELEVVAWSSDMETWSMDYVILPGNPDQGAVWAALDQRLQQTWTHATGAEMRIEAAAIDSGGSSTDQVYSFCKPRYYRRVYAIRGHGGSGVPFAFRRTTQNKLKCPVHTMGVDGEKARFYGRLEVDEHGPGRCHFPMDRAPQYFEQLTAERPVKKFTRGQMSIVWELRSAGLRNEPLDCRIYAGAALELLHPVWAAFEAAVIGDAVARTEQLPGALRAGRRTRSHGVVV